MILFAALAVIFDSPQPAAADITRAANITRRKANQTEKTALRRFFHGGEEGIRTLDTLMGYTRFPIVRARPTTRHLHSQIGYSSISSLVIITSCPGKVKAYFSLPPRILSGGEEVMGCTDLCRTPPGKWG